MKFEEEFPSLGYERRYAVKNISENSHNKLMLITYSELSISKNCIDRQKVKEAIDKFKLLRDDLDENTFYRLEAELGLDK